jgi:hypothetical protein
MPNPKDTPKREASIVTLKIVVVFTNINISDEKTPRRIQKRRKNFLLSISFARNAPIRAENADPQKFPLHIRKVSR